MKNLGRVVGLSVAIGAIAVPRAQMTGQEDGGYRLKVDSRLIETSLTVRDARGDLVTNLPREAFHVREDGAEQNVRYFAARRDLP